MNSSIENKLKDYASIVRIGEECRLQGKKIVVCHGVFDVVHPGHLRHLEYAKSKADILIVSITADRFITKGSYRPHVSELLRARQLAHLSLVDFVVINQEATPEKFLLALKPNYFAKGFEYVSNGLPPATKLEVDTVSSYGGKIIFTPGDVIYSSSNLIDLAAPSLTWEKIDQSMKTSNFTWDDVKSFSREYEDTQVLVLGDLIVDSLVHTSIYGTSTKTPTLTVIENSKEFFVGGAGIVALHFRRAGAKVKLVTTLKSDEAGEWAKKQLIDHGVEVIDFSEESRPTTEKVAFVSGGYRLIKVDRVDNRPISAMTQAQIGEVLDSEREQNICVFSDFRHGIFNRNSIDFFVKKLKDSSFNVADSQVASRWGNITQFKGFDLITPNEKEARFSLGDQDSTINRLALDLINASDAKNLILKLGPRGVLAASKVTKGGQPDISITGFDSFASKVVDAVGAGDALLAYSSLALSKGAPLPIATIIGNAAAAVQCAHNGNIPITPKMVQSELAHFKSRFDYSTTS